MKNFQDEFTGFPRLTSDHVSHSIESSHSKKNDWVDVDIEPIEFTTHPETQVAMELSPQNTFGEFTAIIRQFEPKEKAPSEGLRLTRESNQIESRRICTMELKSASQVGFGGLLDRPVEIGSWMTLYFPEDRAMPAYDVTGEVVKCIPNEEDPTQYQVDVSFAASADRGPKLPQLKLAQ